ncbi:MAG: FAD-dependent oxidoreductase [Alphaproteobacteria bacterium]
MRYDFDLFVIGGGSGGVRAARIAALHGAKVAIAEEFRYGGTCVIRGCIPKKLFMYASHFAEEFEDAAGYGWSVAPPIFSWEKLVEAKDKEVTRLAGFYVRNLDKAGVTRFETRAVFEDAHTLGLTDGRTVTAKIVLIATGAHPFTPAFPGADLTITSNEAFNLRALPRHITIVGGGYIAAEFAGIFHGLGVEVRLSYRGDHILRGFDDDMRTSLESIMRQRGIEVATNEDVTAVERAGEKLLVHMKSGVAVETGAVMMATGRVPNTRHLKLDKVGVALHKDGEVVVDAHSRSNVKHPPLAMSANRVNLTPVAIREGRLADTSLAARRPRSNTPTHSNGGISSLQSVHGRPHRSCGARKIRCGRCLSLALPRTQSDISGRQEPWS